MALLHQIQSRLFAILLDPLEPLGPLGALTLVSAVSGVILIFAFRYTSRPKAIRTARKRVQAHLLAVRLYQDDLGIVFRSQARMLGALGTYMANMLLPFLVILAPFAIVFAQLDARYATRALRPGEVAVVKAMTAGDGVAGWSLETGEGLVVETPPVRIPVRREVAWRVRAGRPGSYRLAMVSNGARVEKEVRVADHVVGAAPRRAVPGLDALLFAPVEPAIDPATGLRAIELRYPELPLEVAGTSLHWIVVFLVVSAAVALALKRRVGAEF